MPEVIETQSPLVHLSNDLADAVERAGASTVAVHARHRVSSSGVLWRPGLIVTADHTVRRDEDLGITLPDGSTAQARLQGRDPDTDLAVLAVDVAGVTQPEFGDAAALKSGNLVVAVARDGEDGVRAASGVISAVSGPWRTWRGGRIDQFISLDLSLYTGFSGGPLVDVLGRVLGITTSALSRRYDLAIPKSTVDRVIDQILSGRQPGRGYLGVGMQPVRLSESLCRAANVDAPGGVIVVAVEPDGPAEKAGLYVGDIIVGFDGTPVEDTDDVLAQLGSDRVGAAIRLRVVRGGQVVEPTVTIGERAVDEEQ
jgi:S1-C subfamily serine protease